MSPTDPLAIDSQEAWDELNRELPKLVDEMLAGESYNAESPPALPGRGIYVFSEGDEHLYVGRTGVSARSRKKGEEPKTSFTQRWVEHTGQSSWPTSAGFAMKLTREVAELFEVPLPTDLKEAGLIEKASDWWKLRNDDVPPDYCLIFEEAKRFIGAELDFRVAEFVDDVRGVRSHVAEVYADAVLRSTYGDFSPS